MKLDAMVKLLGTQYEEVRTWNAERSTTELWWEMLARHSRERAELRAAIAEREEGIEAESKRFADELEAAGMACLDFEWTDERRAIYAGRREKELAAWLPIIQRYLASPQAQDKAIREALEDLMSFEYRRGVSCQKNAFALDGGGRRCLCRTCIEERARTALATSAERKTK